MDVDIRGMSDIKPWKTLQSDVVLENQYLKIRKDICQLPEGTILQDYYVREDQDNAIVFCVTKSGDVVLVRQFRQGLQEITIELPGGLRERHDISMAEAARRELLEETGYSSERLEEIGVMGLSPASSSGRSHIFFSPEAEKIAAPKFVIGETTEVVLKTIPELKAMLGRGEIIGALHNAAMYRALAYLEQAST